MKKKTSLLLACIMVFALIAAGCNGATTPTPTPTGPSTPTPTGTEKKVETLKIGLIQPVSGPVAFGGQHARNGGVIAVEEINEAGGIYNENTDTYYMIELTEYDDQQTPSETAAAATKLIMEDEVVLIMGAFGSSCTMAAAEICNREGVPIISPLSSAESLTTSGFRYFFRGRMTTYGSIRILAEASSRLANADTWAQIAVNDDWGRGDLDVYPRYWAEFGDEVVAQETFESTDTDFYAICTKVLNANPGAIFVTASTEPFAMLIKQLRELNDQIMVIAGGIDPQQTVELVGPDLVDGDWFISMDLPDTPESLIFDAKYKELFGMDAISNTRSGYDVSYVVAEAIARAENPTDRDSLRDAMAASNYDGLMGHYEYDENGDTYLRGAYGIFDQSVEKGWALYTLEQVVAGKYEEDGYIGGRLPK